MKINVTEVSDGTTRKYTTELPAEARGNYMDELLVDDIPPSGEMRVRMVLAAISLPDQMQIRFRAEDSGYWFFQIEKPGACCNDNPNVVLPISETRGRKWLLSRWMADGEIVQTVWLAAMTYVEHELRVQFRYKDVRVFDPHISVDKLVEIRQQAGAIVKRK